MSESRFWTKLRKALPRGDYVRIENVVSPGTPDVNFCVRSVEGFIELKYLPKFPARDTTPVLGKRGLSIEQIRWIERRLAAGGRVAIAVGVGPEVYWFSGSTAAQVNEFTRERYTLGSPIKQRLKVQKHFLEKTIYTILIFS